MPKTTIDLEDRTWNQIEEIRKALNLTYQKEAISHIIAVGLGKFPILSEDLAKKLGSVFIDAPFNEKLNIVVNAFLKLHERFPYLNIDREMEPLDAGFPPCLFVKSLYWKNEFLGFTCRCRRPPLNLPRLKVEKLSFNYVTPQDCWDCIEFYKKYNAGLKPFGDITFGMLEARKEIKRKERSPHQTALEDILKAKGIRMKPLRVTQLFQILSYDEDKKKWNGKGKASKVTGISRPSIDRLIKAFPEGIS